jgi:hypothetical protein
MEKKTFGVTVPVAGTIYVAVEAHTSEEAKEIALGGKKGDGTVDIDTVKDLEELDCYSKFISGNVCYINSAWEIEAEEIG